MSDPTFTPNSAGYRELLMSPELYRGLAGPAAEIEGRAKENASPHYRTGAYESSIHTERQVGRDRVRMRVIADDDVASILEARYHILGRAVG